MRKKLLVIILLSTLLTLTSATIDEKPLNEKKIKVVYQLFNVIDMGGIYDDTIIKMVDVQIQQNPSIAPYKDIMIDFFHKYMGWDSIKNELAQLYLNNFTTQEIKELIEFYKTPLGIKAANLLPKMTAEGAAIGQKRVQENLHELKKMIEAKNQNTKN